MPFPSHGLLRGPATAADLAVWPFANAIPDAPGPTADPSGYIYAVRRFIIVFLSSSTSEWLDYKLSNWTTRRLRDHHPPERQPHPAFPRATVLAAVSDRSIPLVLRTAVAFVWDGLFRAGEALYGPARTAATAAVPASRFAVLPSPHGKGLVVAFRTRSKTDTSWRNKTWSTDPRSAAYNPAHVGSAELLAQLLKQRPHATHIWQLRGRPIRPRDLIAALKPHLPKDSPRYTGHCFRVSAASSLHHDFGADDVTIARLGDWTSLRMVRLYIRRLD